jgi:alkylated DNA nucleotide flippase Atl1
MNKNSNLRFNGPDYIPALDQVRLTEQILRVFQAIQDNRWKTLKEIAELTGDPEASVSAQLRHLRKERFGAWIIDKQRRGYEKRGLWEYRLTGNKYD